MFDKRVVDLFTFVLFSLSTGCSGLENAIATEIVAFTNLIVRNFIPVLRFM